MIDECSKWCSLGRMRHSSLASWRWGVVNSFTPYWNALSPLCTVVANIIRLYRIVHQLVLCFLLSSLLSWNHKGRRRLNSSSGNSRPLPATVTATCIPSSYCTITDLSASLSRRHYLYIILSINHHMSPYASYLAWTVTLLHYALDFIGLHCITRDPIIQRNTIHGFLQSLLDNSNSKLCTIVLSADNFYFYSLKM